MQKILSSHTVKAGGAPFGFGGSGIGADLDNGGGAWIWLPQGVEMPKPWRKRHPVLFWGGILLLFWGVFGWGRLSGTWGFFPGVRIAVVNVEGMILDAGNIVAFLEKAQKDASCKGVLVRINSPGGAVGPSQEIYAAIKRLASVKPVVASMGLVAASGGYFAALGAHEIYAGPSSLTASIGVKMQIPNIEKLMQTIGISEKTLTTGRLKDAGSSWRAMSSEEETYLYALLRDMYDEFIETVSRERNMPLEKVKELADGRAMTGRQAREAGLVDSLGDAHLAMNALKVRCGLDATKDVQIQEGPERQGSWLAGVFSSALNAALREGALAEEPLFLY